MTEETTDLSLCQRPRGNRTRRWYMVHVLVRLQGTPRCKVNKTFGKLKLDLYYFSIICANMFCSRPGKRTPFILLIVHIISPMLFSLLSIRSPDNVDFHTLYTGYLGISCKKNRRVHYKCLGISMYNIPAVVGVGVTRQHSDLQRLHVTVV